MHGPTNAKPNVKFVFSIPCCVIPELHFALKKKSYILFSLCRDVRDEYYDRSLPYALWFGIYSCSINQWTQAYTGQNHFDKTQELGQL